MKSVLGKYQVIIWDWNGTLLNDIWLVMETVNDLLQKSGKQHLSVAEFKANFEYPITKFLSNLGFPNDPETLNMLYHKFIEKYEMNVSDSSLMPHGMEVVKNFYSAGVKQILMSMRRKKQVLREAKGFGVFPFMHQVIANKSDLEYDKFEMLNRFLKYNPLETENVLCVGDTIYDWQVANHFGIDCVLLSGGYQDLTQYADKKIHIIQSLKELQLF